MCFMKLKENLKRQLKENGMTVTSLSKRTKIPLQTLNNWLAGSKPRDLVQVKIVCDFFKVSFDEMVFGHHRPSDSGDEILSFGNFDVFLKKSNRDRRS